MADKRHVNALISADVADGVDAWAAKHDTSRSAAIDQLLSLALGMSDSDTAREASAIEISALRAHIDTITAQLTIKDEQIRSLGDTLQRAQDIQARIAMALPMTQQEQPAGAREGQEQPQNGHTSPQDAHTPPDRPQGATTAPGQPQDGPQTKKRGFWASLWS